MKNIEDSVLGETSNEDYIHFRFVSHICFSLLLTQSSPCSGGKTKHRAVEFIKNA